MIGHLPKVIRIESMPVTIDGALEKIGKRRAISEKFGLVTVEVWSH